MNVEERINELENKIDSNMDKIIKNMNRLHKHEEKINDNAEKIKSNSYALDILKTFKADSNKFFIMWVITFIALLVSLGYIVLF